MKKICFKIAAATLSIIMALSCIGAIRGSASEVVKPIAGQPIGYEINVTKNSSTLHVNLRFTGLENCQALSLQLFFDNTKLTYKANQCKRENPPSICAVNGGDGLIDIAMTGFSTNDDVNINMPFAIKSGAAQPFKFSAGLRVYQNKNGYSLNKPTATNTDISLQATNRAHLVGDVDKSGTIALMDSQSILEIISALNENPNAKDTKTKYVSVSTYDAKRYYTPKLLDANGKCKYNCGIALDVDNNGRIDVSDAEAILYYNSCESLNMPLPDNNVATTRYAVCYH